MRCITTPLALTCYRLALALGAEEGHGIEVLQQGGRRMASLDGRGVLQRHASAQSTSNMGATSTAAKWVQDFGKKMIRWRNCHDHVCRQQPPVVGKASPAVQPPLAIGESQHVRLPGGASFRPHNKHSAPLAQ